MNSGPSLFLVLYCVDLRLDRGWSRHGSPIHNWLGDMNTHKTKATEEVLDGVLVKEVVVDAVVALVQQLPVLGDEVSDWPGGKLLVEVVLHIVDQHFHAGVDPHLLLHFFGHSNPLFNGVVAWYVNHLDQMLIFLDVLASLSSTWRVCVSTFSMTWPKPARFSLDHHVQQSVFVRTSTVYTGLWL